MFDQKLWNLIQSSTYVDNNIIKVEHTYAFIIHFYVFLRLDLGKYTEVIKIPKIVKTIFQLEINTFFFL